MKSHLLAVALGCAFSAAPVGAVDIVFDYRFDDTGFFTPERRTVLDGVARLYSDNLADTLSAIEPDASEFFLAGINNPLDPLNSLTNLPGLTFAADEIRIFVGSVAFSDQTLAVGGPGFYSAAGSGAFLDSVASRGEAGALQPVPTDFAPFGGTITFGTNVSWYADTDPATLESFGGQFDLFTVAVHETAHVLGFGTADSWFAQVDDGAFGGDLATAVNGGIAPALRNGDDAHFASSLGGLANGRQQSPIMAATIPVGGRKYMTDLDWAALSDIGWEVNSLYATVPAPVPELPVWAMALAGLGLLGLKQHTRSGRSDPVAH